MGALLSTGQGPGFASGQPSGTIPPYATAEGAQGALPTAAAAAAASPRRPRHALPRHALPRPADQSLVVFPLLAVLAAAPLLPPVTLRPCQARVDALATCTAARLAEYTIVLNIPGWETAERPKARRGYV